MRLLLIVVLIGVVFAQSGTWRLSTKSEVNDEIEREYAAWGKAGIMGDPPCTMGFGLYGSDIGYHEEPCAYTDGRAFQSRYTIFIREPNGKTHDCEITHEQSRDFWDSYQRRKALTNRCRRDELPVPEKRK